MDVELLHAALQDREEGCAFLAALEPLLFTYNSLNIVQQYSFDYLT
jgi:hypothetical protein